MKNKITLLFAILFATGLTNSSAQYIWTQKADFGGTGRYGAVGFSIGSKGYIGTGNDNSNDNSDFWEYDPATNAWTQKANFGGTARTWSTGFSIGNKGYIGTGLGSFGYKNDFWEYDPGTNTWTQKSDFGGTARGVAVGFSIGNKGYIGTGSDNYGYKNDFWEYDPSTDTWAQKAGFGGTPRYSAVGFSISSKGYIGTGNDGAPKNDFWEYDPSTDTWAQKADFEGTARESAVGFSIGTKGYIGTGNDGGSTSDFREYDPATNGWKQKADFGGTARYADVGFCIGSKGYIGTGYDINNNIPNDFLEYACNPVTVYADADSDGFGDIGTTFFAPDCAIPGGYVYDSTDCDDNNSNIHPGECDGSNGIDDNCNGITDDGSGTTTLYEDADHDGYGNPDSHVNECSVPAGYVVNNLDCNDANASINPLAAEIPNSVDDNCNGVIDEAWVQKADLFWGGYIYNGRWGAVGFSIGGKGYIGTGITDYFSGWGYIFHDDFWEFDPNSNTWAQKASFGGTGRGYAVGFSIGNKGYIGTGYRYNYGQYYEYPSDFWEYDPIINTWMQKADFGGGARESAVGFSIGSKGYIGTGGYPYTNDFWEYDPALDTWTQKANFGGTPRFAGTGFSIGSKGYIGTGYDGNLQKDFWEYDPGTNGWTQKANFGGTERSGAVGFSIGSKGYIGTGFNYGSDQTDFWEYDPASDIWTQKADLEGSPRQSAVGFSIGSNGYIGTGLFYYYPGYYDDYYYILSDFWEYSTGTSACEIPINLSVTNITSSSAKLKWDAVAGAEGYKVRYKVANTSVWTTKNSFNLSKTISGLSPNTAYKWEVKTYCHLGAPSVSSDWSSKQDFTTAPLRMGDESLQQISFQIYPNPAEDHATIQFTLPYSSHISIKVYDVSGKEIITLLDDDLEQGDYSLLLNTNQFSKGIYLVKMISDFGIENQKLIVQ